MLVNQSVHPFRKNLQESDLTSAGNRGIRLLKGHSSWVIHKISLQCTLSWSHKEMTQKPPDPGLEECLSAGVGGQCSLKGLEAKQRAEHVVESHQWTSRDPGNDLDSTLVIEFLLCAWDKSTFPVFSKFPSASWMGTSADSMLPHYCDHQLLQENVEK